MSGVYFCRDCQAIFASAEEFDVHYEDMGHAEAAKLKPLCAAELDETGKTLVFFDFEKMLHANVGDQAPPSGKL